MIAFLSGSASIKPLWTIIIYYLAANEHNNNNKNDFNSNLRSANSCNNNDNIYSTTTEIKNSIMMETQQQQQPALTNPTNQIVLDKLRALGMHKKETPHHSTLKRASVLVPLFERPPSSQPNTSQPNNPNSSSIHVLFTQRPTTLSSHPGEVCFPGGQQDPSDRSDDLFTALRETCEEIGLSPHSILPIARMETVESKHSLCVTPIIGWIDPPEVAEPSGLELNLEEVEAAFAVPLEYFAREENCVEKYSVEWSGGEFVVRTYLFEDGENHGGRVFRIWGLTAHVVYEVAKAAFAM